MAKLTFVLEDGEEVVIPLTERITIGSDENNDVMVDDERISPQHAELMQNADGSIQVFDLQSKSGTFINDVRQQSCTLLHGDRLAFGPLKAVLDLEDDATAAAAPSPPVIPAPQESTAPSAPLKQSDETEKKALAAALQAEREQFAKLQTASRQAEVVHSEWLASIKTLTAEHTEKTTVLEELADQLEVKTDALQKLSARHDETVAALQQLTDSKSAAQQETEALAVQNNQVLGQFTDKTEALKKLSAQHDKQAAALEQVTQNAAVARQEIATLAAQKEQELAQQQQRHQQRELETQQLADLRQQLTAAETRIRELGNTEEKHAQALARSQEADAQHATLAAAVAALVLDQERAGHAVADLEHRLAALQDTQREITAATAAADTARLEAEAALSRVQTDLTTATQQLAETQARHVGLASQCQKIAAVDQQLVQAGARLTAAEKQRSEVQTALAESETRLAALQPSVEKFAAQESATKERADTLRETEKKLRATLNDVTTSEQNARARLEEIRQLTIKEQKDRAVQQEELALGIESAQREIAHLETRLGPLRHWQEAMNQRYTRLAAMPQDSPEARELLQEIAAENATLFHLITAPHLPAPRIMHVEFARLSPTSGVPMKSERSRGQIAGRTPAK